MAWWQMVSDTESLRLRESVEAMRLATEEIDKKLGDAYPNGLAAEIEDIKKRLQYIEGRVHFLWDHIKIS